MTRGIAEMNELIKEGAKCIAETLLSDATSAKFEDMQNALKDHRHVKLFLQAVENAGERYGREFSIPKDALTEEMLQPGVTAEVLAVRVEGILNKYVLEGHHTEEDAAIIRQICQEYLKSVRGDIVNADVIRELHAMKEEVSAEQHRMLEFCTRIEQALRKSTVAESTIEYQKLYKRALFWDKHITLDQVYMEPKVQNTEEKITKILDAFLQDTDQYLLVIEGAPGIGKSSLLGMLADRYVHRPYYFLRLSDLDLQKDKGLQSALSSLIDTDESWKNYQREGNILFFDGYDEVRAKLTSEQVITFVKKMKRKGVKVVMTTRPSYWTQGHESYERVIGIREYEYSQVEQWIKKYLKLKGSDDSAIEQKLRQLNDRRTRDELSGNTNECIMDVLGIPIFLYIIYNKGINLNEISSKTELYENVFLRLLEDKSEEKPYAQEVAMCLGFFLQATEERKLLKGMRDRFQKLLSQNSIAIDATEENNLDALLGNSFIRKISEGDEEREFYHKSIKDYFSAKYIMRKIEKCNASQYTSLLDKHDLREEMPHLKYFINKIPVEDKKALGVQLQRNFLESLLGMLNAAQEPWFDCFADMTHVSVADIAIRNRRMFENQMQIMHKIFEMPIVEDEDVMYEGAYAKTLVMARELLNIGSAESKEQFFWRACRYLCLNADNIGMYMRESDFAGLFKNGVYICDVRLRQLRHRFYKGDKLNFCMEDCTCEGLDFVQGRFEKSTITRTTMLQVRLDLNVWRDLRLTASRISESIFSCVAIKSYMKNVRYKDCTFRSGKLIGGVYDQVTFEKCTFEDFDFIDLKKVSTIKNVSTILFKECEFKNVSFEKCTFTEENFIDCKK